MCLATLAGEQANTQSTPTPPAPTKCELTFHGGAGRVSGSLTILDTGNCQIAIDCGSFYPDGDGTDEERKAEASRRNSTLPSGAKQLSTVLVTHAHIDHIGRLPLLAQTGFQGRVFLTPETGDLAVIMLGMQVRYDDDAKREWRWSSRVSPMRSEDRVQTPCGNREASTDRGAKLHWRRDCEWDQKIARENLTTLSGTFSEAERRVLDQGVFFQKFQYASPCRVCADLELRGVVSQFEPVKVNLEFRIAEGVYATALDAGHIPGSCSWLVRVSLPEKDVRLLFSGDLGNNSSTLITGPKPAPPVDLVAIETTYGSASVGDPAVVEQARFRQTMGEAIAADRLVWIPAFALDRTQKILHQIAIAQADGSLPSELCVYVPSPSANAVTAQYLEWPQASVFRPGLAPLESLLKAATIITSPGAVKSLSSRHGVIVITTSGMLDEVFSRELLPQLSSREDVEILLVGYQDPGTMGGRLERAVNESAGGPVEIPVDGSKHRVKATVRRFRSFSAHARSDDMDRWLQNVPKTSRVVLVHGDAAQLAARQAALTLAGWGDVVIAEEGKTMRAWTEQAEPAEGVPPKARQGE